MTLDIAKSLRNSRKEKGLTMKQLAEKIGTSLEYIHEIETEKATPSLGMLKKITDELELSVKVEPRSGGEEK